MRWGHSKKNGGEGEAGNDQNLNYHVGKKVRRKLQNNTKYRGEDDRVKRFTKSAGKKM